MKLLAQKRFAGGNCHHRVWASTGGRSFLLGARRAADHPYLTEHLRPSHPGATGPSATAQGHLPSTSSLRSRFPVQFVLNDRWNCSASRVDITGRHACTRVGAGVYPRNCRCSSPIKGSTGSAAGSGVTGHGRDVHGAVRYLETFCSLSLATNSARC